MAKSTRYLGLDVHAETIVAAIAEGRSKVRSVGAFRNRPEGLRKLLERVGTKDLKVCYEAGPTGYALYWELTKQGVECEVIAPSMTPQKSGERIKTDRRDAEKLAEYYRAGLLTRVWVPTAEHEALRDLVRARAAAKKDETRAKHRVVKYLLRNGLRHPDGRKAWSHRWWAWVHGLEFEYEGQRVTFEDCVSEVQRLGERVSRLELAIDRAIEKAPAEQRAVIEALQALRGVAKLTAVTVVAEVGTFQRFERAGQLMGYAGLVPSEYSSGSRESRGRITRNGSAHLRRVLGESAWHARHRPWLSARLKEQLARLPSEVADIAWKAQERLHRKFTKLLYQKKPAGKVATAVARELVGFIWAIGYEAERKALAASV